MGSEVDCSGVSRAVWLVKVPKYLSNIWMTNTDPSGIVGSLQITNNPSRNEVMFNLSEALAMKEDQGLPSEYKMVLSKVDQSIGVFSRRSAASPNEEEEKISKAQITIEGVVVQRADCRPTQPSANYFKLKKQRIEDASKSGRKAKQVERVVKYRPVSDHKANIEHEKKKKDEGKRAREDEDVVKALLFNAFERHQYYNLKDLISLTKQPVMYLKTILKEIGHYNTKNPHKNMWELKPEYRHYSSKSDDGGETTS
ncbi:PREDICTED: general transcription factor IIF subunit 2-like [Acropora digitifera]|uniref:general transcription factor IIF subunit 2-like n=1 Tax=Acropora digitifera TaxID=70779 RepID=UPI00077A0F3F|nr:PREDICTED: general transcription factor IIF subunit 2-like [Acropora digitifera]